MSRALPAGLVVLLLAAGGVATAQEQPKTIRLEAPSDGASVGRRPRFVIAVPGADVLKLRFKITLTRDEGKTIAYTFDESQQTRGWVVTELADHTPAAMYYAREALEGGRYQWTVASWDGRSWKDSAERRSLIVDVVPPADVEGVQMLRDEKSGCVRVTWQAVTTDRDGGPEHVAKYHVYRYTAKGPTAPMAPFQAGETAGLELTDCRAASTDKPVVYYRVVAEDEAGNIPGSVLAGDLPVPIPGVIPGKKR